MFLTDLKRFGDLGQIYDTKENNSIFVTNDKIAKNLGIEHGADIIITNNKKNILHQKNCKIGHQFYSLR